MGLKDLGLVINFFAVFFFFFFFALLDTKDLADVTIITGDDYKIPVYLFI